jgi:ATP-dependent helicase HrpA
LLEEFGYLQQKGRRVDLIADDEVLFQFFDERIPDTVVDGNSFNRWRRAIEQTQPELLMLARESLCGTDESTVTAEQYPDQLSTVGATVKLVYRFEPGHAEDGVTAVIPVHQLNQVSAEAFEWLVPGLLKDKVTALIKALPKSIRKNFVPATDYAAKFLALAEQRGSLLKSLASWLSNQKRVKITPESWSDCALPDYLFMHFRIVDEDDEDSALLASGRDFRSLKVRLARDSKQVFSSLAKKELLQSRCTRWEFGEIPQRQPIAKNAGHTFGFPALVDEGETVGLSLFDTEALANIAHESGLARLILLQLPSEVKYLKKTITGSRSSALSYSQLAPHPVPPSLASDRSGDFDSDLLHLIVRLVFLDDRPRISNQFDFENRLAEQKHRLVETAERLSRTIGDLFRQVAEVAGKLERVRLNPTIARDIREQMALLIYRGFIARTPAFRLQSFPRYLKAISHRIDKAVTDEFRDLKQIRELEPLWSSYWAHVKNSPELMIPELDDYRWRLEELRVSLFAQNLKTAYPVSCKRLEKLWEARC